MSHTHTHPIITVLPVYITVHSQIMMMRGHVNSLVKSALFLVRPCSATVHCLPAYKYSFDAKLISQCRDIMKWLDCTESRGSLECGTQRVMCGWSCGQEGARFSTWQVDTMCFCFSVCQHLYKVYIKMGNRCNRASMSGSDKRSQILTLLFQIK